MFLPFVIENKTDKFRNQVGQHRAGNLHSLADSFLFQK